MDQEYLTCKCIRVFLLFFATIFSSKTGIAQANLSIVLDTNKAVVSPYSFILRTPGDTFPQTYFYDTTGKIIRTNDIFKGKPVIFITGSYTCPAFRHSAKIMNAEVQKKHKTHDIYFVYIHEAHPLKGSPYGPKMDSFIVNRYDSIFMQRQYNLGDRMQNAIKSKRKFSLNAHVLIDNEHNDFFLQLISAPNGYMEFSPQGILIRQRDWYHNKRQMRMLKKHRRKEMRERKKHKREPLP